MGEAYIMRRGGGISNAYAVISVTYPSGSTCTCTNGTKTLRAKDTSGSYLFLIPEAGTWTVSCTDGSSTASKSVTITAQYQAESISLDYAVYLFKSGSGALIPFNIRNNGSQVVTTIGTEKITSSTSDNSRQGSLVSNNRIDFTPFSVLHAAIKVTHEPYNNDGFGLRMNVTNYDQSGDASNPPRIAGVNLDVSSNFVEYVVDVSGVTGSYFFNIWGIGNWECTNIWLE